MVEVIAESTENEVKKPRPRKTSVAKSADNSVESEDKETKEGDKAKTSISRKPRAKKNDTKKDDE